MAEKETDVVQIILAILLPPIAVYMKLGLDSQFWINIVLTLLCGIPGIIHALWIVLKK
jgi:uncharacterized membrane protein YqaE (UPF0057 family)